MKSINKIYRIKDKRSGQYISLGYNRKATWLVFPNAVIKNNIHPDDYKNYQIDMFETNPSKSFELNGQQIITI